MSEICIHFSDKYWAHFVVENASYFELQSRSNSTVKRLSLRDPVNLHQRTRYLAMHSVVTQWQSARLLSGESVVRAHPTEPYIKDSQFQGPVHYWLGGLPLTQDDRDRYPAGPPYLRKNGQNRTDPGMLHTLHIRICDIFSTF